MPIDPRLYQKYSGKMPGEAMTRYGQSLAKQASRGPSESVSFFGALKRGRMYTMIGGGLLVAAVVIYMLITGGI
jgi:hypothetical protein